MKAYQLTATRSKKINTQQQRIKMNTAYKQDLINSFAEKILSSNRYSFFTIKDVINHYEEIKNAHNSPLRPKDALEILYGAHEKFQAIKKVKNNK